MSEPSLDNISDYNTLEGEKRKVVTAVVLSGLIIGIIYVVVYNIYDTPKGSLNVEKTLKHIPMK